MAAEYCADVNIRQTATTAAGSTIWTLRHPTGTGKYVYIERLYLVMNFDVATPVTRQTLRYQFARFSTATPTGGTALTAVKSDSTLSNSIITDIRQLDTGLTMTSVVVESAFMTIGRPAVDGSGPSILDISDLGFVLAPGEGFCIQLDQNALTGQTINGTVWWSER